jgi:2-polyprenyl-6-methoxyphenol hydroxylase-like FAD-dependent oxidoreductase
MEIAIVGAGPVGIFFANLLLNNGHQVTLVESGNLHGTFKQKKLSLRIAKFAA